MQRNRELFPSRSVPPTRSIERGFFDLTRKNEPGTENLESEETVPEVPPIETALLSLCCEIAGTLIRGLQEMKNPRSVRILVSEQLREKLEIQRSQADCIVALSIELIRVKSAGRFLRDPAEMKSLISGALGEVPPEGLN